MHTLDELPRASLKIPKGLCETRLYVGEEGPADDIWNPASHAGSGATWWPGLGGVELGREA